MYKEKRIILGSTRRTVGLLLLIFYEIKFECSNVLCESIFSLFFFYFFSFFTQSINISLYFYHQHWRAKFAQWKRKRTSWPRRRCALRQSWKPWPGSPTMPLGSWSASAKSCWRKRGTIKRGRIDFIFSLTTSTNQIQAESFCQFDNGPTLGTKELCIDLVAHAVNLNSIVGISLFHFVMLHLDKKQILPSSFARSSI